MNKETKAILTTLIRAEQAEISFKAGVEQGRKEVVEWLRSGDTYLGYSAVVKLQAQLKKWGIE